MDSAWWLALVIPVVVSATGLVTWWVQSRREQIRRELDRLRDERRALYLQVMQPFVLLLSKGGSEAGAEMMTSPEHAAAVREFTLIGSDAAVKAMNEFMQYLYQNTESDRVADPVEAFKLLGRVFLEMRKELGNPKTTLEPIDMFKYQMTDIEQWGL